MPSAAILNGGQAVRYGGVDKGALVVDGRTIRDRQLGMLVTLSDDIMIVGGAAGYIAAPGRPAVRWIPDFHPGQGPLAGIEAALAASRHGLTIVLACDMPAVSADLVTLLLAQADDADIVVPRTGRGYHPLCAIYRSATCLPVVRAHLETGTLAVRALFPELRVREVNEATLAAAGDPERLLANVNTPAEHEALGAPAGHEALSAPLNDEAPGSSIAHKAHEP